MLRVRTALTGWEGGPGLMTFYFETPLQNDAAAARVVGYVHDILTSPIATVWPSGVSAQVSGEVDVITAASGAITDTVSASAPSVVTGTGSEGKAPPAVAALIRLVTSTFVAGRRVRGRIFVSPLAGSIVTSDGLLNSTSQGYLEGVYTTMAAAVDSGDTWVVWHRPKSGSGGSAAPITATTVPFKLAVLTSRRD